MKRPSKTRIGYVVLGFIGFLIAAVAAFYFFGRKPLSNYVARTVLRSLQERFGSDAKFASLEISVYPSVHVTGTGLVIRVPGRDAYPPLIRVKSFTLEGSVVQLMQPTPEFSRLHLEGLEIHIPPKDQALAHDVTHLETSHVRFKIGLVEANEAVLYVMGHSPERPGLEFDIHELRMKNFRSDASSSFHAVLTNPKPVGDIETDGEFGPWNTDEPAQTPVSGQYQFSNADLSTLGGIAGSLSSKGKFDGVIDTISVTGETETPDFSFRVSGHVFPLTTDYDAVVDGTNGNVELKSVHAHFLDTSLVASGSVAKEPGEADRRIDLDVYSETARVEDLLRLAVSSPKPVLTGSANLKMNVALDLHKGQNTFQHLYVAGEFGVGGAKFTSDTVQSKIDSLSKHGLGEPDSDDDSPAVSDLKGVFKLEHATMNFSQLSFAVEGAAINLTGKYGLEDQSLDFQGSLKLQAKLSQTQTGLKSVFLKLVDPLFEKDGAGTFVPIHITGTRSSPVFGVEIHHVQIQAH